jgi:rfaE bifunctional protein kinase chain/domain
MTTLSEALAAEIRAAAPAGSRIVLVYGYFNAIHPGHLRQLYFAADQGDYLVVGVFGRELAPDATNTEADRSAAAALIECVDQVVVMREAPELLVAALKPAVVVKGREFAGQANPEKAVMAAYGGRLVFSSGEAKFTSFDLLDRDFRSVDRQPIELPKGYPTKHGIDFAGMRARIAAFNGLRVCVFGDIIIDEYVNCDALGMSQEDPTIVVRPLKSELFLGGAGIVAAHARSLGAEVTFLSVVGADSFADYARERLTSVGVRSELLVDEHRPTTHKKRYRASGKTMLRVNSYVQQSIDDAMQADMLARIEALLPRIDLLIFSDFSYGALPQPLVDQVIAAAQRHGVMIAADSQSSSQTGDVSRFRGATLITPTEREARLALNDFDDGLVALSEKIRQRTDARHVFVTLGAEGVLIHTLDVPAGSGAKWLDDRLPAFNLAPKDPAGAGDAMLVSAAMALCQGAPIWEAAFIGSLASAVQVGRVGNIPLTAGELLKELENR